MFKYWSKSEDGEEYDFNEKITESLTLYAIWELRDVHTITFDHDLHFCIPTPWPENQYIDDGGYVREPIKNEEFPETCFTEGEVYNFEYWHLDGHDEAFDYKNTKVASSFTIIAHYEVSV